ncbi:hypothetical protein NLJ89_g4813 [Agrocybe chaxingu]|uniref:Uncharacterized protein n=1 Tax=Agrocybe chaxingu TaxID=84603 RepID=A0A9W8MXQ7_9AGAR|nr:hypothetical protein NLJ89_g4813 [Agrocybe chaxingu]
MAQFCGENVSVALGSPYGPLGIMDITKTEDFRPNVSFMYDAGTEPNNISVTEYDTFTLSTSTSTAEVDEEKSFYSMAYTAASKKVKTLAGYIKSWGRLCSCYSSSMIS